MPAVAPDRMAVAHEMVDVDQQRERAGQADQIGDVHARAGLRDVSDGTINATAAVKGKSAALKYAVPCRSSSFRDVVAHGLGSHFANSKLESNLGRLQIDKD